MAPALAIPVSWVGPPNGFWDVAGNWSPGLPGAVDGGRVLRNEGTLTQAVGDVNLNTRRSGLAQAGNGSVLLGANALTIATDYDNAGFGLGNAFNRRANIAVTGAGNRLIAAGDANQGVSGVGVANGSSTTPNLLIGNVRVGANLFNYNIDNTGSSGPALRGAIQTSVNGASLTDARLSGSGVAAGSWGPLATGASLAREVVLTVDAAGVYAPLGSQSVAIVNNFDNTRSQLLAISSASDAAAYNLATAAAITPNPVVLPNQRQGGVARAVLTLQNTAPAGSFTEGLDAAFGALTGAAMTNGAAISLLAGGASNSSTLAVGVDTSAAGSKIGTATVTRASDGSGTSGLGSLGLGTQSVSVSGQVYAPAAARLNTSALNFGIVHVDDTVASRAVSVSNTAAVAGLNDLLLGALSGAGLPFSSGGTLGAGLAAGGTDATGLRVALDTSAAGVYSNSAQVLFASHNAEMADLDLGNQGLTLAAQVNHYASAAFAKTGGQGSFSAGTVYTLDFGTRTAGEAALSAQLALLNTAIGPAYALRGAFDLGNAGTGDNFVLSGFDAFGEVAAIGTGQPARGLKPRAAGPRRVASPVCRPSCRRPPPPRRRRPPQRPAPAAPRPARPRWAPTSG